MQICLLDYVKCQVVVALVDYTLSDDLNDSMSDFSNKIP